MTSQTSRLTRVGVTQPVLLPWVGLWNKVLACDVYVVYAAVQYAHGDYFNRVTLNGSWLTVPVAKGATGGLIKDTRLADGYRHALAKLAATLRQTCMPRSAKFRDRLGPIVTVLESWSSPWLMELTNELFLTMLDALEPPTRPRIVVDTTERPLERLAKLDACLRHHAGDAAFVYLCGAGGRAYMGHDSLARPAETWFQQVKDGVPADTALQLIATHARPLDVIARCAVWVDKDGQPHAQ